MREGIPFRILVSDADETSTETSPAKLVEALSSLKAESVMEKLSGDVIVLGADTVVSQDGRILGKPASSEEAEEMIRLIEGRAHEVYTGVTLIRKIGAARVKRVFSVRTSVHVREMSDEEIRAYIALGESYDKAGAYAIQGAFGKYIDGFTGDRDNVIGLPVSDVKKVLKEWGYV